TTTTPAPACPSSCASCEDPYYSNSGGVLWDYEGSCSYAGTQIGGIWHPFGTSLACVDGHWVFSVFNTEEDPACECAYTRPAEGDGDCPDGLYSLAAAGDSCPPENPCPTENTVYS
ncbi:MAG TPA: hypothetical protein VM389_10865, partial [Phycisphaerae bacterium]|nr:hypothetical protein [Phycisphaerae bacterium]